MSAERKPGQRGIEERVGGKLDEGFGFDAHQGIGLILSEHRYANTDEFEQLVINTVLGPLKDKMKGFAKIGEGEGGMRIHFVDGTVLEMEYIYDAANNLSVRVESGFELPDRLN